MLNRFIILLILINPLIIMGQENKETWLDVWREATVSIGIADTANIEQPDGKMVKKKIFIVVGTGVLFYSPWDKTLTPFLVTAKHIFLEPSSAWEPESLKIRFSWFDDKPVDKYFGITLKLKEKGKRIWFPHPNDSVDIACIPLIISPKEAGREKATVMPFGNFVSPEEIYDGAQIQVLGYPSAVGPNYWNKAILRQGIISWSSPTNPEFNEILIDCNIFPGNSGGPVFKVPTGTDRYGNFIAGGKASFLGIVSQMQFAKFPVIVNGEKYNPQLCTKINISPSKPA
jgi:hypothetical protein